MGGADADDGLNFVSGARKEDGGGQSAKSGETVALVGLELISLYDDSVAAYDGFKVCQDRCGYRLRLWSLTQHFAASIAEFLDDAMIIGFVRLLPYCRVILMFNDPFGALCLDSVLVSEFFSAHFALCSR